MKSNRTWLLVSAVVVILIVLAAWYWRSQQGAIERNAVDLVEMFPDAEKRTTMASLEDAFAIQTVTIDGDRKQSIFAHPFSRIIWKVTMPERAVLRTAAALRPDAWAGGGDGALFRIGVSDGSTYTEFVKLRIRPADQPGDRRWFPAEVDLSRYAGQDVQVIFNTEPGEHGNAVGDACVWGAPRIVPGVAAPTE
jgi:hypothetical protein